MKKQIKEEDIEGFDNIQKIYFNLGRKQALEEVEKIIDELNIHEPEENMPEYNFVRISEIDKLKSKIKEMKK